jgi:hypothetical protein
MMRSIMTFAAVLMMGVMLAGCAKKTDLNEAGAPANVVAAFHKAFPGAHIQKIEKEEYPDGQVHYEFVYTLKGQTGKRDVELDEKGNVLGDH